MWGDRPTLVLTEGLIGGVIDTLDIVVMPEALGAGVPLFTEAFAGRMRPETAVPYENGAVRLVYNLGPTRR